MDNAQSLLLTPLTVIVAIDRYLFRLQHIEVGSIHQEIEDRTILLPYQVFVHRENERSRCPNSQGLEELLDQHLGSRSLFNGGKPNIILPVFRKSTSDFSNGIFHLYQPHARIDITIS